MLADQSPLVSVVTTAFQAEAHVARALRSASLLDTDAPMEIILFDDGSTDGTLAAARAEAEADPRIRVIEGGRQGRARALNLAIRAAKGRYIAILDADDVALPYRLRATLPILEAQPALAMACSEAIVFEGVIPRPPAPAGQGARGRRITPAMHRLCVLFSPAPGRRDWPDGHRDLPARAPGRQLFRGPAPAGLPQRPVRDTG